MSTLWIHCGYGLMLAALVVRDILWLRAILIIAQSCILVFAWQSGNFSVAFWNLLFILINAAWVARILFERRKLPIHPALSDLYEQHFKSMSTHEFLYFWETGTIGEVQDTFLIREGEHQHNLSLILSGTVLVYKENTRLAVLGRGHFLAEMSFLTREHASADVVARGQVTIISWNQDKLRALSEINPLLFIKLQNILGRQLVDKIRIHPAPAGRETAPPSSRFIGTVPDRMRDEIALN